MLMKIINFRRFAETLWTYKNFELSYNNLRRKPWNLTSTYRGKPTNLKDGKENFEAYSLFEINEYFKNVYGKEIL